MKTVILFDLDGTLTDSAYGIIETLKYALNKQNIIPPDDLRFVLGPPLMDTFINTFHMSQENAQQAYDDYRQRYAEKGMYQNSVFEGVKEMLSALKKLAVTTSKAEDFANKIIEHFGLSQYFDCVAGNYLNTRDSKEKVVRYALEQLQASPEEAILVGDRMYDVIGGKKAGVDVIGVLYGYGEREELEQYGADVIVETPQDVVDVVLNWDKLEPLV